MKKLTLILGAVALIAMTSCKKDYTCECENSLIPSYELKDQKKKDAEDGCAEIETAEKIFNADASCTLK